MGWAEGEAWGALGEAERVSPQGEALGEALPRALQEGLGLAQGPPLGEGEVESVEEGEGEARALAVPRAAK